ncbi:hypothetical protein CCHR01_18425 [Colletotrichum chrysophilum]|uniref:Uncharacterized protein n=1 Tax=Colletotrichum chrysophilum TaxID=1836956 RepID=A0AAD9EBH1_9PEZI|nr:hypothetical protein CCHR01_18425 [Colletotrichum chrysophilum]
MLIRPSLSSKLASLRRTSCFIPPLAPSTSAWTGTFAATAAVIVAAEFVVVAEALAPVAAEAAAVAVVAEAVVAAAAVAAEPVELAAKPFAVAAVATAEPVVAAAAVPAEPVEVPETPAAAGAVAAEVAVAAVATAEPVAVVVDVPRIQAASAGLTAVGVASTIPTQVAMEPDLADGIVKSPVCCIVEAALHSATSLVLPHSRIRATHSWVPGRLPRACAACRHCAELPSGRIPKARI